MVGTKLMHLSKDISLKMFWIGGGTYIYMYQPLFEFTETGQHQWDIIDTCFIYLLYIYTCFIRIKGRNTFYTVAKRIKGRKYFLYSS